MHHPRKKLAAISLLAATSAIGLGATATAASASSSPISFTYWTSGFKPSEIATIDSAFDKAYPAYQANGQYISTSDTYFPKVIAALKSNTQPTVYTDQQPYDLPVVQESGKLIPLTGKLGGLTNQLYPGIRNSLFYRGQQLGMALGGVGDIALFYNKSDFAQAGITSPPTTWAQLASGRRQIDRPLGPPLRLLRTDGRRRVDLVRLGAGAVGRRGQPPQRQPDQGHLRQCCRHQGPLDVGQHGPVAEGGADGQLRRRREL